MTKREFIMQYVLNRALGHKGGLAGYDAVLEGERAWNELEKRAPCVPSSAGTYLGKPFEDLTDDEKEMFDQYILNACRSHV